MKAEDYRILCDFSHCKAMYQQLRRFNEELVAEHSKRQQNYEELMANLKKVNQVLQNAGKLRAGQAKTRTVQGARAAIKRNDVAELVNIIQTGNVMAVEN